MGQKSSHPISQPKNPILIHTPKPLKGHKIQVSRGVHVQPPRMRNNDDNLNIFQRFGKGIESAFNYVKNRASDVVHFVENKATTFFHKGEGAISTVYKDVKSGAERIVGMVEKAEDKALNVAGNMAAIPQNVMLIGGALVLVLLLNSEKVGRGINSATGGKGIRY